MYYNNSSNQSLNIKHAIILCTAGGKYTQLNADKCLFMI